MRPTKTLQQRERELRSLLVTSAGQKERAIVKSCVPEAKSSGVL